MIFIHHIEKTGITSIEWSLYKGGLKVWNGCGITDTAPDLEHRHNEEIKQLEKRGIDVYVSHFDTYFGKPLLVPPERACTVIREPVARTISHVAYLYDHRDKEWMIGQKEIVNAVCKIAEDPGCLDSWKRIFALCPYLANCQIRRLVGCTNLKMAKDKVDKMLIVEPFERLEQFYERLCCYLNVSPPLLHINKSISKWEVPDEVKMWIGLQCRMDTQLWAHVLTK